MCMQSLFRLMSASIALACFALPATAACSNRDFCRGWNAVCHRTLVKGADPKECTRRFTQCLTSGCYFFNVPRPRCKTNAEDVALTLSCQRRG